MKILFYNSDYIVCVKSAGMDSESDVPKALKKELGGKIFTVHRLDFQIAGVMVYARTKNAAAEFSKLIQNGSLIKEYEALVHGTPPKSGIWEDLLWKDSKQNKVFVVKRARKGVRSAKLSFDRLSEGNISLIHVRLYTGRSHQIRVQFASRGFPLAGDHRYGARDSEKVPMLFSCRITFPWHGKQMVYEDYPEWGISL